MRDRLGLIVFAIVGLGYAYLKRTGKLDSIKSTISSTNAVASGTVNPFNGGVDMVIYGIQKIKNISAAGSVKTKSTSDEVLPYLPPLPGFSVPKN